MKSVLISIHPKWCVLIASGKKTVEVRKTRPKMETPFKCYIYQCKFGKVGTGLFTRDGEIMGTSVKNGKVIGEFVCDEIICATGDYLIYHTNGTCLTSTEIADYIADKCGCFWHISDLVIYDKPRELSEFSKCGFGHPVWLKIAPQSWCYVESEG